MLLRSTYIYALLSLALSCAQPKSKDSRSVSSAADIQTAVEQASGSSSNVVPTTGGGLCLVNGEIVNAQTPESKNFAGIGSLRNSDGQVFCTATMILQDTVLTARHCIENVTDISFHLAHSSDARKVTSIVPYEGTENHDVAILKLERPFDRQVRTYPISRLPLTASPREYIAVGYGLRTDDGRVVGQGEINFGRMKFSSHVRGQYYYGKTQLAEFDPGSKGQITCPGDSGGPVLAQWDDELYIVGVTSGSYVATKSKDKAEQCLATKKSYVARADHFVDWVQNVVQSLHPVQRRSQAVEFEADIVAVKQDHIVVRANIKDIQSPLPRQPATGLTKVYISVSTKMRAILKKGRSVFIKGSIEADGVVAVHLFETSQPMRDAFILQGEVVSVQRISTAKREESIVILKPIAQVRAHSILPVVGRFVHVRVCRDGCGEQKAAYKGDINVGQAVGVFAFATAGSYELQARSVTMIGDLSPRTPLKKSEQQFLNSLSDTRELKVPDGGQLVLTFLNFSAVNQGNFSSFGNSFGTSIGSAIGGIGSIGGALNVSAAAAPPSYAANPPILGSGFLGMGGTPYQAFQNNVVSGGATVSHNSITGTNIVQHTSAVDQLVADLGFRPDNIEHLGAAAANASVNYDSHVDVAAGPAITSGDLVSKAGLDPSSHAGQWMSHVIDDVLVGKNASYAQNLQSSTNVLNNLKDQALRFFPESAGAAVAAVKGHTGAFANILHNQALSNPNAAQWVKDFTINTTNLPQNIVDNINFHTEFAQQNTQVSQSVVNQTVQNLDTSSLVTLNSTSQVLRTVSPTTFPGNSSAPEGDDPTDTSDEGGDESGDAKVESSESFDDFLKKLQDRVAGDPDEFIDSDVDEDGFSFEQDSIYEQQNAICGSHLALAGCANPNATDNNTVSEGSTASPSADSVSTGSEGSSETTTSDESGTESKDTVAETQAINRPISLRDVRPFESLLTDEEKVLLNKPQSVPRVSLNESHTSSNETSGTLLASRTREVTKESKNVVYDELLVKLSQPIEVINGSITETVDQIIVRWCEKSSCSLQCTKFKGDISQMAAEAYLSFDGLELQEVEGRDGKNWYIYQAHQIELLKKKDDK